MQEQRSDLGRVRILMQGEYNRYSWSFFTHHIGNSWHGKDARLIFWVSGGLGSAPPFFFVNYSPSFYSGPELTDLVDG